MVNKSNPFVWGVDTKDQAYISQPTQRNAKYSQPKEGGYTGTAKHSFIHNEGCTYPQLMFVTAIDEPEE